MLSSSTQKFFPVFHCKDSTDGHRQPVDRRSTLRLLQKSFSASDPAQNPYWKRDVRRAYPQLSVVTQVGLSQLLIEHSGQTSVAAPQEEGKEVAQRPEPVDLAHAISTITAST
ncbi:hypothetical protein MPER_01857, partial [Moniliophthora perniciosa FA553]